MKDSWIASLVWGRIGAAVLVLIAAGLSLFGYSISPEETNMAYELIAGILAGIGGIMALVSKIRERRLE
jgi:ABC-type nickel/cobalt efflux system permease component RcnA